MKPWLGNRIVIAGLTPAWLRIPAAVCLACCFIGFEATARAATPDADSAEGAGGVMLKLLAATRSDEAASALDLEALSIGRAGPDSGSPTWPVFKFLLAETHRLRSETTQAYACYSDVIASGIRHPDRRPSPGRSLAALSLLRAARLIRGASGPNHEEAQRLMEASRLLLAEMPTNGILELPVLGGLPRLEETLLKEIALLAWSIGNRAEAGSIFLEYLAVASTVELDQAETELVDYLVSRGLTSPGELALVRGRRCYDLRKYESARRFLNDALAAEVAETRAGAGYYLARTRSIQRAPRKEVLNLLTSALQEAADPDLVQEILFYRATVFNREGRDRDIERFAGDLNQIIECFPAGGRADDALHELATHHDVEGDTEEALQHFARLRDHPGPNDWLESSHFRAAMMLYSRSGEGDVAEATGLLQDLVARKPAGQLGLAARFWLGRVAGEQGDSISARRHFEAVIAACPYDYYAIRARMHLNSGPRAAGEVRAEPNTRAEVLASYEAAPAETLSQQMHPAGSSLRSPAANALYDRVLETDRRLRDLLPEKKQSEFTMEDLDRAGAFASLGLLLALRQDAIAAATPAAGANNRLAIASSAGRTAGDWPLAMLLVFGLDRSIATQAIIQHDPHYLAAAYPPVYIRLIATAADIHGVSPELLYAVIRRESLFYPAALSRRGALGLFQFIPSTFETLDSRWRVLDRSGKASMETFLRDPALTIDLGARWFREELLERNDGDVLLAVMEHNAGYPAVKAWREAWERSGRNGDIEYMIETARFAETRIFARSVLTDMVIAEAVGLFGADHGTSAE